MERKSIVNHINSIEQNIKSIEDSQRGAELETELDSFREKVRYFDHGERDRFFSPSWVLSLNLNEFDDKFSKSQFKSAFKTVQKSALKLANRYLKDMKLGLKEFDQEETTSRQNY